MIRAAQKSDGEKILEIYRPIVERTAISFETKVPTLFEMENRIESISSKYPYLVFEKDGDILGYSYASQHRTRDAYRWSVDATIYVSEKNRGQKTGEKLYRKLFKILKDLGYFNVYAGITLPNDTSVGIHEKFGFSKIAHYNRVGYKIGAWHDVGWWELVLSNDRKKPFEPIPFSSYLKK
jgi:phosphinothricin acetyltransferase